MRDEGSDEVKSSVIRAGVEGVFRKMPARPGPETVDQLIGLAHALRMADRIDSGNVPYMHWFLFQSAMRAIQDAHDWCDDVTKDS